MQGIPGTLLSDKLPVQTGSLQTIGTTSFENEREEHFSVCLCILWLCNTAFCCITLLLE